MQLRRSLLTLVLTWTAVGIAFAASTPHLSYVYPAGGRRGTEVELTVEGLRLEGAVRVIFSADGIEGHVVKMGPRIEDKRKKRPTGKKRRPAGEKWYRGTLKARIGKEVPVGVYDLRLAGAAGVSNALGFFVSELPEANEKEPNDGRNASQAVESLPVVLNGCIMPGDRDVFRFALKKGTMLVCALQGRAITPYLADAVPGWIQACLTLYDERGRELIYADDFFFDPDPVLVYRIPKDGSYLLEVRDALYRGREDFVYRLRAGALPFVTSRFPLGGKKGSKVKIDLKGVNLCARSLTVKAGGKPGVRAVRLRCGELESNALAFETGGLPESTEREPNDKAASAMPVSLPVVINGRSDRPGDADFFAFELQAGEKVVLEVKARRLGSPLDSILTLFDARSRRVAENDDYVDPSAGLLTHHADSYLVYQARTRGRYVLRLRDVQGKGSDAYGYRLRISRPLGDFVALISPDNPLLPQGGTTCVALHIVRRDGCSAPVKFSIGGLPEGCRVKGAFVPAGRSEGLLTITAAKQTPAGVYPLTLSAEAGEGKGKIKHAVIPAEDRMQAFIYHQLVHTGGVFLAVAGPAPASLTWVEPPGGILVVPAGGKASASVLLRRAAHIKAPVRLKALGLPKGITARAAAIPPARDRSEVTITAGARFAGTEGSLVLEGTVRVDKEVHTVYSEALRFRVSAPAAASLREKPKGGRRKR